MCHVKAKGNKSCIQCVNIVPQLLSNIAYTGLWFKIGKPWNVLLFKMIYYKYKNPDLFRSLEVNFTVH